MDLSQSVDVFNGDVLAETLADAAEMQGIVFRECLMEGPLLADSFDEFIALRATFIEGFFDIEKGAYATKSQSELEKLEAIDEDAAVYLWFEFDVFCQVHLWYTCWRLLVNQFAGTLFWIRPNTPNFQGFRGVEKHQLAKMKSTAAIELTASQLQSFASLWVGFSTAHFELMVPAFKQVKFLFPAEYNAIEFAWRYKYDRKSMHHPAALIKQLAEREFEKSPAELFALFQEVNGHYGIADTQFAKFLA